MSTTDCRAALAQPEPEGMTDDELLRTYSAAKRNYSYDGPIDDWPNREERAATVCGLRAVLARHGRPAVAPVALSERPWEREGWCDAEGYCWEEVHYEGAENEKDFIFVYEKRIPNPDCYSDNYSVNFLPHWAIPLSTTTQEES